MSYFKFKKRPAKSSEHSKLVEKVDNLFSEVIRLRDCDNDGMVKCITCGEKLHWREIQCGHFIRRVHMATRWHLQNCHPQCGLCNGVMDGREDDHAEAIDKRYGAGTADQLRKLQYTEVKFMEHELNGMATELRAEIRALKIEKGMI